jgi:hypothetical protein
MFKRFKVVMPNGAEYVVEGVLMGQNDHPGIHIWASQGPDWEIAAIVPNTAMVIDITEG